MLRLSLISLAVALAACSGTASGDGGADASGDLGEDLGEGGGPRDAGAPCTLACAAGTYCCAGDDGGAQTCASLLTDDQNCGGCGIRCADGRGTTCVGGHCVCGHTDVGCAGSNVSSCCPSLVDGGVPYCANFVHDGTDCGSCGHVCDSAQGSTCIAGGCACGAIGRVSCSGADTSHCCIDTTGLGVCADLTSDRYHCGSCDRTCSLGESCIGGTCTLGPETCTLPCMATDVCCHGVCCYEDACRAGLCGAPDAGP